MPLNDTPLDYSLLERLTQAYGPSGVEDQICQLIKTEIAPYCDEIRVDALGNLIATKHGKDAGKHLMVAAHMDEIGVMVTFIDGQGFLRFTKIGGVREEKLFNRRVRFENGLEGTIGVGKLDKPSNLKLENLYIDIGVSSKVEAEELVHIGSTAVFVGAFNTLGNRFISKAFDDRVGCFTSIEAMKRVKTDHTVSFVFTVQEEVGTRGAKTSAYALEPDLAISVDVTSTGDEMDAYRSPIKLGEGAAIKVMDRSMLTPPQVKEWMERIAKENSLPYQWEILDLGGNDGGAILLTKGGIPTGVISIPTRYVHSPSEMVDRRDVETAVSFLVLLLENPMD